MSTSELKSYAGSRTADIPAASGIYAWYYRPVSISTAAQRLNREVMSRLVDEKIRVSTEVHLRYNLKWKGTGWIEAVHGGGGTSAPEALLELLTKREDILGAFIRDSMVPVFSRPIYIGMAESLYNRVYIDHWMTLQELWDSNSSVSKFIAANPTASVQEVLDGLGTTHSFALEARVRGLAPKDLMAYVVLLEGLPHADSDEQRRERRMLEHALQLLADPICGRM